MKILEKLLFVSVAVVLGSSSFAAEKQRKPSSSDLAGTYEGQTSNGGKCKFTLTASNDELMPYTAKVSFTKLGFEMRVGGFGEDKDPSILQGITVGKKCGAEKFTIYLKDNKVARGSVVGGCGVIPDEASCEIAN